MKLIVTHEQPDFDALASLALAQLLHPDARPALSGGRDPAVNRFLSLYRDVVDVLDAHEVDPAAVTALVVVDTNDRQRIRPFDALVERVPVTLYDHHPPAADPIPAGRGVMERVGATVTLLVRALQAHGMVIPAPVASLALIGLHEDTGNLTFRHTTPDDCLAAATLLEAGASLALVRRFTREPYSEAHEAFRARMLEVAETRQEAGLTLATAVFEHPTYLPGVSALCNDLLDLTQADAALLSVAMEGRTLVFARAGERVDVAAALGAALGGGGHPGAAFAKSELPPDEALARVLAELPRSSRAAPDAAALMSHPVKTVAADATVAEAQRQLSRYGHNGVPVLEGGELVGILSRRDLERALQHGLGRSEVRGFMTREVVSADERTSLEALEALVERHNIGRIPILRDGELVGIVTRTDLLAARHPGPARQEPAERVRSRLPLRAREVLQAVAEELRAAAGDRPAALYLVGGTVRDALLGSGMEDLDLALEGVAVEALGAALQRRLGGRLSCHLAFGTCTLELPSGLLVDLATTREEHYAHPGALPEVIPSTLRKDLSRRDFTVNALALRLVPEPAQLLDPYRGRADLDARELRVLHPLSFVEDPTRIVRGARLAGRLAFRFEADAAARARAALAPEVLRGVSHARLRSELELTLQEARPAPCLRVLAELDALDALYGLPAPERPLARLDDLRQNGLEVPPESYLLTLLAAADDAAATRHVQRFHWPQRMLERRRLLRRALHSDGPLHDELLEALEAPGRAALRALAEAHAARVRAFEAVPRRRKLRGQDVLDLGLPEGPLIGRVLREVAAARAAGTLKGFEEERAFASRMVQRLRATGRLAAAHPTNEPPRNRADGE